MTFQNYLKLFRFKNLLIVAATQYAMRWCVINPILKYNNFSLQFNEVYFALFVLATVLITAAGYIINDYFDTNTDLVNNPEEVLVGKSISRKKVVMLHIILNSIAVLLAFFVSWRAGMWFLGFIFLFTTGLLWFYSTMYKKMFLIGNLIVATLTALVPLMVAIYEIPLLNRAYGKLMLQHQMDFMFIFNWVMGFSFFAFITTLTREIIKDMEDYEGDNAYGRSTLPIVLGTGYTKMIAIVLSVFTLVSLSLIYFNFLQHKFYLIYTAIFILGPYLLLIYKIFMAQTKKDYHFASGLAKAIMLFGVGFSLVAMYIFTH
jgi:4-hydroxybenzoate polyprenyltransferase